MSGPDRRPGEAYEGDMVNGFRIGRHVFRSRTAVSFLLALVVLYLMYSSTLAIHTDNGAHRLSVP